MLEYSNEKTKLTILVFSGAYLPGYMAGGPIRTISNLVYFLGDEFDFRIVTLDRDMGGSGCYPGIKPNEWQRVGKADVFYISPNSITMKNLCNLINSTDFDVLYINSYFSPNFTIKPLILRRISLIRKTITIIAPRGEFSAGALKIKAIKKILYLLLAKLLRLYENAIWQASSSQELKDISTMFEKMLIKGSEKSIMLAPNLIKVGIEKNKINIAYKKRGDLKVIFLSRISQKKNLDGALRMLINLKGNITFNIYGPIESREYWKKCRRIVRELPPNINVNYKGPISHEAVVCCLSNHNIFFLPTHGENYGHAIIEAFISGCPVLLSDQTPWRGLEAEGVGWDISLSQPDKFTAVLQKCVDMEFDEMKVLSQRAREYGFGLEKVSNEINVQLNRKLFYSKQLH